MSWIVFGVLRQVFATVRRSSTACAMSRPAIMAAFETSGWKPDARWFLQNIGRRHGSIIFTVALPAGFFRISSAQIAIKLFNPKYNYY